MEISKVLVDEEQIYQALANKLMSSQAWKDLMPTNTGSTIISLASAATTVNQHAIHVSLREAFLSVARRDSSIYESTRSLGVRINRKTSAAVTVSIENRLQVVKFIPAYSAFLVGGTRYFNREQLMLPPGINMSGVNLFQGEVVSKHFDIVNSSADELQTFKLGIPNFAVSNDDLLVYVEDLSTGTSEVWTRTQESLLDLSPRDKVYYEFTSGDGDVAFMFGDGEFGSKIPNNSRLHVRAVVTTGLNSSGIAGEFVRYIPDNNISGLSTSSVIRGADQKSSLYYKLFAPVMFRSRRKAISSSEVRSHIMGYPGVADVSIFTQKDIAPNDPRWQNTMRVCILPETVDTWGGANPNPKSAAWSQFIDWLQQQSQAMAVYQTWNPVKVFVRVEVLIAVQKSVDTEEMRILALERILKLFQRKPGILGRRLSKSDIESACRLPGVDYIEVISPLEEIIPTDKTRYVVLDGQPIIHTVYTERNSTIGAY
jgi:hypothetical protein